MERSLYLLLMKDFHTVKTRIYKKKLKNHSYITTKFRGSANSICISMYLIPPKTVVVTDNG